MASLVTALSRPDLFDRPPSIPRVFEPLVELPAIERPIATLPLNGIPATPVTPPVRQPARRPVSFIQTPRPPAPEPLNANQRPARRRTFRERMAAIRQQPGQVVPSEPQPVRSQFPELIPQPNLDIPESGISLPLNRDLSTSGFSNVLPAQIA